MTQFYFQQPVPIDFGYGKWQAIDAIIKKIGGTQGILMTTPSMVRSMIAAQICERSNGKITMIYSTIPANPTTDQVNACIQLLRKSKSDFAIALGGGSVIDCAKMAAAIAPYADDSVPFCRKERALEGKGIPLIAIPTTAGTASEISNVSVITDTASKTKTPIASPYLYADYALVDPALTVSCTPYVTATSGIDVLAHSLEALYNVHHQPYTDVMAIHAAQLVFENLLTAYREPENVVARTNMCEASVAAGFAFSNTQTAASHACSYPLTEQFNVPHGEACAITLAAFWRLNAAADMSGRLNEVSRQIGFDNAEALADAVDALKVQLGLAMRLSEVGVQHDWQLSRLIEHSYAPNIHNNPVAMNDDNLRQLYESVI